MLAEEVEIGREPGEGSHGLVIDEGMTSWIWGHREMWWVRLTICSMLSVSSESFLFFGKNQLVV